jgi:gliding motility-associated-like protein
MALSGDDLSSCLVDNGSVVVRVQPFPTSDGGLRYTDSFSSYDFDIDLYTGNQVALLTNSDPLDDPAAFKSNIPAIPFVPAPGSFISDTLGINLYTVRLIDRNTGCVIADTTSVVDGRKDPVPLVEMENPLTNCDDRLNGQLTASADGNPISYYDFRWWLESNPPPAGDTLSYYHKLVGVDQGTYVVRVVNKASGCFAFETGTVTTEQVFPPAPDIELISPQTQCWWNDLSGMTFPSGWLRGSVEGETVGYRFDWYVGSFTNANVNSQPIDTTGVDYIHLQGDSTYTMKATILATGCYSVATEEVPLEIVIPKGKVDTTPSFCLDSAPGFIGNGSVILSLTNSGEDAVVLRDVFWTNELGTDVGSGTQVFELPPGVYTAEIISNEYCRGWASGEIITEIRAYNLVSPNNSGLGNIDASGNDWWIIDCISEYPNNNVKVFNRYGVLVFEKDGYDNTRETSFKGIGENGVYSFGNELPDGTYFYIIDKRNGQKPITGFLELVR